VYAFALLGTPGDREADVLNVDAWRFFVLPTAVLDRRAADQKRIGLSTLLSFEPVEADFAGLPVAVERARIG
jgi:hypothetical protein